MVVTVQEVEALTSLNRLRITDSGVILIVQAIGTS